MAVTPPPSDVFQQSPAEEESRMMKKIRDNPVMGLGMAGWVGIVGYGLYTIKNRKHGLGLHLIHTRVYAQTAVVGAMTIGLVHQLYTNHFRPWYNGEKKP